MGLNGGFVPAGTHQADFIRFNSGFSYKTKLLMFIHNLIAPNFAATYTCYIKVVNYWP